MKGSIAAAMMMYMMMNHETPRGINNRVIRNNPPWYKIHLPKSVRKGLSYEEQQELKKKIWEKENEPKQNND